MKILQVNIFYNQGSTGRIVADIHRRLLRDGHESYIVFGRGEDWQLEDPEHLYRTTTDKNSLLYRRISRVTGLRYNTACCETGKLFNHIDRIKPDIVHLHCLNCAYVNPFMLLKYLGRKGYKVLVTHHADVTITANCDHSFECDKWKTGCGNCATNRVEKRSFFIDATHLSWMQMKNAFAKINDLYASGVSDWMTDRVRQSPFFKDKECRTILNGLDTTEFTYRGNNQEIRQRLGIKTSDRVVLHVTPDFSDPIKGGKYVGKLAQQMQEVKFIIVGIKRSEVSNLPHNVIPILHTDSKEELSEYYSLSDVTIVTSYRESFSMVTAESLCSGTPVVGFKAGAPEIITIPEFSDFVEFGDLQHLVEAIDNMLNRNIDKKYLSEIASRKYDAESMYSNYLSFYESIFVEKHEKR